MDRSSGGVGSGVTVCGVYCRPGLKSASLGSEGADFHTRAGVGSWGAVLEECLGCPDNLRGTVCCLANSCDCCRTAPVERRCDAHRTPPWLCSRGSPAACRFV